MSKIETLKAYAREQPQLQIVESVQTLQRSIEQLQSMPQQLQELPDAIAQIIGPMSQSTEAMAERVDKMADVQRQAISQAIEQIRGETKSAWSQTIHDMQRELSSLRTSAAVLSGNLDPARQAVDELKKQAQALARERAAMKEAGQALSEAAQRARGNPFMRFLGLLVVGLVSAAATLIGAHVLDERRKDMEAAARAWMHVQSVATPQERESLLQIVRRPAR